ncbi:unnamed protein product [Onchocerca flexuosa]|uniref:Secreted protein n=1 Tax=Onchocerca flexuosa TaxID=387005 RepID=A0A183HVZ7_9BILA|nr:unnamed protein product [Onchocerca flexuosa]
MFRVKFIKSKNIPNATPTAIPSGMLCTVMAIISKRMRRHETDEIRVCSLPTARLSFSVAATAVVVESEVFPPVLLVAAMASFVSV